MPDMRKQFIEKVSHAHKQFLRELEWLSEIDTPNWWRETALIEKNADVMKREQDLLQNGSSWDSRLQCGHLYRIPRKIEIILEKI